MSGASMWRVDSRGWTLGAPGLAFPCSTGFGIRFERGIFCAIFLDWILGKTGHSEEVDQSDQWGDS